MTAAFDRNSRKESIDRASHSLWDLVVIGGGATGAACARDAALRGLKVILLEAQDFASGTSSGSSKLIHGGIRYLENFEFSLVFEAIQERETLKKLYAPFVRPLEFVFPTYKNQAPSKLLLRLGLSLYDSFSFFKERHKSLSRKQALKEFPQLRENALTGAQVYSDSFTEDYRLVIELIKSAHRNGASCLSYCPVKNFSVQADQLTVEFEDHLQKQRHQINARRVINCAGPFSDEVRSLLNLEPKLKLTQGVHFVIPGEKLPIRKAFVLSDPEKNRILFAIPWNTVTYLGTTDTSLSKVREARATQADWEYVSSIVEKHFLVELRSADVIQSWAAVRPLIRPSGDTSNSKISREHQIQETPRHFFHIFGGKLTSHRRMAEEAVDLVCKSFGEKRKSETQTRPLQEELFDRKPLDHLDVVFGQDAHKVRALAEQRPSLKQRLKRSLPHLQAEIVFCIQEEMCLYPIDYLRRRSSLYYESPDEETIRAVLEIFCQELNASAEERELFLKQIEKEIEWDQKGFR